MPKNRLSLAVDVGEAARQLDGFEDAVDDGAKDAVKQLAVLAEGPMRREAPEGVGTPHLRDTIDTRFRRQGLTANVGARKRTEDGRLLAEVIVEGTGPDSYATQPPYDPLVRWAEAKLGDGGIGYYLAEQIGEGGHETLPNDFVNRSLDGWEDQVDEIAGENIQAAMSRLMRGRYS